MDGCNDERGVERGEKGEQGNQQPRSENGNGNGNGQEPNLTRMCVLKGR